MTESYKNYPNEFPCVNCGACCKKVPCVYGEWNEDKSACKHLMLKEDTLDYQTFICGDYERIASDPDSWFTPAFGAGCCRTLFNEDRAWVIHRRRNSGVFSLAIPGGSE